MLIPLGQSRVVCPLDDKGYHHYSIIFRGYDIQTELIVTKHFLLRRTTLNWQIEKKYFENKYDSNPYIFNIDFYPYSKSLEEIDNQLKKLSMLL